MSNAHLRDEDKIREGIARAEFVQKGIVVLSPGAIGDGLCGRGKADTLGGHINE